MLLSLGNPLRKAELGAAGDHAVGVGSLDEQPIALFLSGEPPRPDPAADRLRTSANPCRHLAHVQQFQVAFNGHRPTYYYAYITLKV